MWPWKSTISCYYTYWTTILTLACLVAGQSDPKHEVSSFDNLPARLFFFDDTQTAIFHDSIHGNVLVSMNEGKSWAQAKGVPPGKATLIIEHPFDNRIAFIITNDKRHYRTEDRGETWRSFDMPIPPALVARPLSFHSDPQKYGYILYQGTSCERVGWNSVCHDETYYTKDNFSSEPKRLLSETSQCQFAHSSKDFKHDAHPDLIYCVAFDAPSSSGSHSLASSRLFSSTDFFENEQNIEDLGIGKNAKGVVAFAIVSKYAVVALKDLSEASDEMLLYVTVDTKAWAKAQFPHASSAKLRENAYTVLQSTTHSLGVDVLLQDRSTIGTLFLSNSNGTFFMESLKDTNRNHMGFVDYERLYGIDGVGLANVVSNAQEVETRHRHKLLKTYITYNDGRTWSPVRPPSEDSEGRRINCDPADKESCSLHLHSVTAPHNFGRIFSSPAPGFAMGVGSIGEHLKSYEDSDTFLSTDGGQTWKMVRRDAHKYEFGDQGSILVVVNDEEATDIVRYSLDLGKTWKSYNFGIKLRARALVTLPDSTSQKFLLLGQVSRKHQADGVGPVVIVYLDFAPTRNRKCDENDFERWYARRGDSACIMGHKQWYKRRKPDADCYVGEKYMDPVEHDENCECTDDDYECDYNFIRHGNECVPAGPEPIPPGVCTAPGQKYKGSSGFRKIPGNTCTGGIQKDTPVEKDCSKAQPSEGNVVHQMFEFSSQIVQHAYFKGSTTILVRLLDQSIWQSSNEGYTWQQLFPDKHFLAFYHHKFAKDRAYLITDTEEFFYTTNYGQAWHPGRAPTPPNTFGAQVFRFHPTSSDNIIWVGNRDCRDDGPNCHAEAKYSTDNGRKWSDIDNYVKNCAWAKDAHLDADPTEIICESYEEKKGSQRYFGPQNHLQLIAGASYYERKKKLFENVVGFAKFSEFLVVAEVLPDRPVLELQVSLDGNRFASGQFPPSMHPNAHAYTVLESNTRSLFLHMTMSEPPTGPYWGNILKSNSNGTYFGLSLENANRNEEGFVDFEKVIGLDGVALVNVVADPNEATLSGRKKLHSRITHNDGGTWKRLNPPLTDSLGRKYDCTDTKCALHIHGYTERTDPRATYSSPGIVGLLIAVGNVGETLAPYDQSDTFISRDAGFTWEEIHKDAHMWEFGDSGSILVIANDEEPTDRVLFSTDEGRNWREYRFLDEKIRVNALVTVTEDTSRRFILFGNKLRSTGSIAVHIDFSALTSRRCVLDVEDPNHDDFELWSPSLEREERCLFGRQTLYHRRVRNANCVVGDQPKTAEKVVQNCPCSNVDFECEFNHVRNGEGECVLVPGTLPLPDDDSCQNGEDYWYERTPYRLIPYSSCEGGYRPDRGKRHICAGFKSRGPLFWLFVIMLPFAFTALVAYYYYRRSGLARGTIRLPGDALHRRSDPQVLLDTLASVPWYLIGIARIAYEWVVQRFDRTGLRTRRGYRNVPVDEDAQILRFEDEE